MLNLSKYLGLAADRRDYRLRRGESFQYDVPADKRGQLRQFRGKCIRLICTSSGTYRVWIRVVPNATVSLTPDAPDALSDKPDMAVVVTKIFATWAEIEQRLRC